MSWFRYTSPRKPLLLRLSILIGSSLLLVDIFRWSLVEWLTPFLEPLLEIALGWMFLAVLCWSIGYALYAWRKVGVARATVPLLFNATVLLLTLFVPFTQLTLKANFHWHYNKRVEVATALLNGKPQGFVTTRSGNPEVVQLPKKYSGTSAGGGEVLVTRREGRVLVFFFTYRGILDNYSGYVFSSDNSKPTVEDFGDEYFELEQIRPNWYWAASR